jgi:hypothetical protein
MAHLELVPPIQNCWFCEVYPATTTRMSANGTQRPSCYECSEVAAVLSELELVTHSRIPLTDLCIDLLLSPYQLRGGRRDSARWPTGLTGREFGIKSAEICEIMKVTSIAGR